MSHLVQEDRVIKEKRTVRTVLTFTFSCLGGAKGDPEEYLHQYHPLLLARGIARKGARTKGVLADVQSCWDPAPIPSHRSSLSLSQRHVDTASVSRSIGT